MDNKEQEAEAEEDGSSAGSASGRTPPYISFSTLMTFLNEMKVNGIPPQIDRSVLTRFSGGVQNQLMLALRSLGLVDGENAPTPQLAKLVAAYETDSFKDVLRPIIKTTYPYVFDLDLMTATPSMFAKAFSDNLSAKEDVLRKCRTFFLQAVKAAEIPVGPRIETAKFPRAKSPNTRSKPRPKKDEDAGAPPVPKHDPTPPQHQQISEKALEYRLVDLMSEAAGNPEVMTSIINVITFLKTKEIKD